MGVPTGMDCPFDSVADMQKARRHAIFIRVNTITSFGFKIRCGLTFKTHNWEYFFLVLYILECLREVCV